MSFTATSGIPAANNNPSQDQPDMLTNNDSFIDIWDVDHVGFNASNGGTHLQSTYDTKNPPGAVSDPAGIAYTNDGTVSAAHAQYYYKNSQGVFPLSAIRAFGSFVVTAVPGAVVPLNDYNVASITSVNSTTYTVALTANSVNTNAIIALVTINNSSRSAGYTFTNPNLSITISGFVVGNIINFVVIQI